MIDGRAVFWIFDCAKILLVFAEKELEATKSGTTFTGRSEATSDFMLNLVTSLIVDLSALVGLKPKLEEIVLIIPLFFEGAVLGAELVVCYIDLERGFTALDSII